MLTNEKTALLSSKVLLVPYCVHHVPVYHEWMQDPDLQSATASEPLSLVDEYAMQRSWRQDHDKLTFIICKPATELPLNEVKARELDTEDTMIGDINLFLVEEDSDHDDRTSENLIVGEIELMIARVADRRKGYGRAALLLFLKYIVDHFVDLLAQYGAHRKTSSTTEFAYLRVKINHVNTASLELFQSIGFEKVTDQANYFGEHELRLRLTDEWVQSTLNIESLELVYTSE